jgi:hypothetical protein
VDSKVHVLVTCIHGLEPYFSSALLQTASSGAGVVRATDLGRVTRSGSQARQMLVATHHF